MLPAIRNSVLCLALLACACGRSGDGALEVAVIGSEKGPFEEGVRLSVAGQLVRAATMEGLVGLDELGQVRPALADRWIVTDDGKSYIFRLRDGQWADGSELTSESARSALRRAIGRLNGTSLGIDLTQIDEIRAMAGRVVEIRLKAPMPEFLQLLAQPELGLERSGKGTGPMSLRRVDEVAVLSLMPPEDRGLPMVENWVERVRELRVRGVTGARAIEMFDNGEVDLVLNGKIESLPLVETGPLSAGTVRIDPAIGLFGLSVVRPEGFLGEATRREAIAMAIDRQGLIEPFKVGGWVSTTRLVAPGLASDLGTIGERWQGISLSDRRAAAAMRVRAWKASSGGDLVELTVDLPEGPGGALLLDRLRRDLGPIGIELRRPEKNERAHLVLVDRVARFGEPRWFLNQFHCRLRQGICSSMADRLVNEAIESEVPAERAALLAEAEAELTALNGYIPFGEPVRWSLLRGGIDGYDANRWVFHPLPELATIPR